MFEFYVEKATDESGAHMVHRATCSSLPATEELYYLGVRSTTTVPLSEAANLFSKSTPCPCCMAA